MKGTANLPKNTRKRTIAFLVAGLALLLTFVIVVNVLAMTRFDTILSQYFGGTKPTTRGETYGADTEYVKSDFATVKDLYAYEEKLCAEIAQDGAVLLKNDGLLPLAQGTQLDLYSVSSVNLISGGSGSGSGSFHLTADLKEGLENAGFTINHTLWNFYKSGKGSAYKRGVGVVNYGRGYDWGIHECPLSVLQSDVSVMDSIDRNNVAMFVIARTGGEGGDEPRDMLEFGGRRGEHYLELNAEEKEIIQWLGETYNNVIILVNTNNAFELGWLQEEVGFKNVKAAIHFPGAGRTGTYGLGYLLRGKDANNREISPSGHLVDTFVYDNFSSPAMQNFGDAAFTDEQGRVIMSWGGKVSYSNGQYGNAANEINEDAGRCPYYFVTYNEGIYVGYKYYETRYEDYVLGRENVGEYDYAKTVVYPFGFGSSYTSFEWTDFSATPADQDGNITLSVTVKNVGLRSGRDVIQLYYQAPYTDYDKENYIEKAAVNLAGFKKTGVIKPGESEKVELTVNVNDFKSYDDVQEGGYLLETGEYYVTLASDAHMAVNNILKAKRSDSETLSRICETSAVTGMDGMESTEELVYLHRVDEKQSYNTASNLFDDANLIDRSQYLSRNNWAKMDNLGLRYATKQVEVLCPGVGKNPWGNTHIAACAEIDGKQFRAVIPEGLLEKLITRDSLIPESEKLENTKPTLNKRNGLELIDMRGLSYEDPLWDRLLEQLTVNELSNLVAQCGYCSPEMKSVAKPPARDLDGPAGLNKVVGHGSWPIGEGLEAMTWATEYMLACSWDVNFALKMGECIGEDGLYGGINGWYGPAMNIHRTPFSGRNFEYYSEDAYLSGIMGKNEVQGAARKGMYAFIKHFAVNDQETHRDQNGLVTFLNEQSLREIYLRPFALAIVDNTVEIMYNQAIKDANGNTTGYEKKTATIPAATAIMSSFNRIGATWAGGHYNLITGVLRDEFGFKGFVLTDYDTGDYMINSPKQMLEAGGDAKLNTIGVWNGLKTGADKNENIRYAQRATKNVLYTVVNSSLMNGYVHGVRYVPGVAYYKLILLGIDSLAFIGMAVLVWKLIKTVRKGAKK